MNKPVRILHVLGCLNRGGAETLVMNLYRNINREVIQFDFLIHSEGNYDYSDEIKTLGGNIYSIPSFNGKNYIEYKKSWDNFFQNHKEYKILHTHVRSTAAIFLKIAKKYGVLTIVHSHNTSSGKGIKAIGKDILQYFIRYRGDYFFSCSKMAGEWLFGKRIVDSNNHWIIKNAIDTNEFIFSEDIRREKRKEMGLENKLVIGHIGRFHPQKNHMFIINIFAEIYKKNHNSVLILVGDGELRKSIEEKTIEMGLKENVIFTGVRKEISVLLQVMDVFLLPSLHEGLPVVGIEAQSSGLPILASDTVSKELKITDLLEFYSLNYSTEMWADRVIEVNNRTTRKNVKEEIVKAGYDISNVSKWLESFYLNLNYQVRKVKNE